MDTTYDERLAAFSRERLDGHPVPDDLRVLLLAHWEGRDGFAHLLGLEFFEDGELHPFLDTAYLSEQELADPEMQAVNAGVARMVEYVQLVAKGVRGGSVTGSIRTSRCGGRSSWTRSSRSGR